MQSLAEGKQNRFWEPRLVPTAAPNVPSPPPSNQHRVVRLMAAACFDGRPGLGCFNPVSWSYYILFSLGIWEVMVPWCHFGGEWPNFPGPGVQASLWA